MSIAVEASSVVLGYGSSIALSASSFVIPRGAVTAVIGPNGSGKSTVLNAIAGLMEPISGTLVTSAVDGSKPRIAYVLQSTKVNDTLPVTVREVVTMGRYAERGLFGWLGQSDREAIDEAMMRMDIVELGGEQIHSLSGGQRQRAFVAQGLVQVHDLLLLDEPLTGIDMTTAHAIDEVIHDEVGRGCAVVLTTHDLSEARVADHVLLLSGAVVASGPPEAVLTGENLVRAYGPSLLHVREGDSFLDDAAHDPVDARHLHRDRSIHTETSPIDLHGDQH